MHSFWRLQAFLRPYRWHMAAVIVATFGVSLLNLAGPWILREFLHYIQVQRVMDGGLLRLFEGDGPGSLARHLAVFTLLYAGVYAVRGVCQFVTSYLAHVTAWNFVSDLRVALYHHLQKLSLRFYHDKQTGELMSRVMSDTERIEPLVAHNIPDLIVNSLMITGIAAILFYLDARLALLTLLPIPLLLLAAVTLGGRTKEAFKHAQARLADFSALLQDNISGIKEIQIFTRERYEGQRVRRRSERYTVDLLTALRIMAIYHPTVEFLGAAGTFLIIFFGGRAVVQGLLPVEDLVAFFLYQSMLYQPIMLLARMNEQVQMALASSERVADLLDEEPDVKEAKSPVTLGRVRGEIVFENVDFSYVPGVEVLKGISFRVRPGESLALVGPTGVGKSTIASLIPRFYDPTGGRILIDGVDIRSVSLPSLRANISMVLQDTFLFNGTVLENILYGNPGKSREEAVEAARMANAHEFIMALPDGYDTHIGERGVKLSGGQKQRLSIARAILKDAPILILDEATSAVDVETESLIQDALRRLMQGRTTIVIAHRLSTVRDCTHICVLEGGRIVQFGSHQELIAADGPYRRMWSRQLAAASLDIA
nr:ABC transporter ATP-binding protein [Bacillota bacterium]